MKKLLNILSSFAVTATGTSTIVACGKAKGTRNPPNPLLTAQEKADKAKDELKLLNITVSIGDDEKTKDEVINHIKNATEIKRVIVKYETTITQLTVKLSDDSNLEDSKIADDLVLKVSGKLTVDTASITFDLTKVTLKVIDSAKTHKQEANDAASALSNLTAKNIKFKASNLTGNKVDDLKDNLFAHNDIADIIKDDVKLEGGTFTLEVNDIIADENNLVDKAIVTVSGHIEVKREKSDNKFSFTITLDNAVTKINLFGLSSTATVRSKKDIADFKAELIKILKQQADFSKLVDIDLEPISKKLVVL